MNHPIRLRATSRSLSSIDSSVSSVLVPQLSTWSYVANLVPVSFRLTFEVIGCHYRFPPSLRCSVRCPWRNDFIDSVPQHIRQHNRLVLDGVLPAFAIELSLSDNVNVEFESNIVTQVRKDHTTKYHLGSDFGALDHLASFEYLVENLHRCSFRRRWE